MDNFKSMVSEGLPEMTFEQNHEGDKGSMLWGYLGGRTSQTEGKAGGSISNIFKD